MEIRVVNNTQELDQFELNDDWTREPGVAISSCNDGFRPVIFKLEATDIPSEKWSENKSNIISVLNTGKI